MDDFTQAQHSLGYYEHLAEKQAEHEESDSTTDNDGNDYHDRSPRDRNPRDRSPRSISPELFADSPTFDPPKSLRYSVSGGKIRESNGAAKRLHYSAPGGKIGESSGAAKRLHYSAPGGKKGESLVVQLNVCNTVLPVVN